jgi:hypothetical protein
MQTSEKSVLVLQYFEVFCTYLLFSLRAIEKVGKVGDPKYYGITQSS